MYRYRETETDTGDRLQIQGNMYRYRETVAGTGESPGASVKGAGY
uniref:Uncharacterized protein n=1 Tax=Anguilla anguilla TaxID=7936 RepID=A0A0E9S297_ANGAN